MVSKTFNQATASHFQATAGKYQSPLNAVNLGPIPSHQPTVIDTESGAADHGLQAAKAIANTNNQITNSDFAANLEHHSLSNTQPLVGVIDTGFKPGDHGARVADAIAQTDHHTVNWQGTGVGTGQWANSLTKFVDAAKASGQSHAVANLSFDLTQVNPDGSVTTRQQLTSTEQAALQYAHDNGVLIVASSGNQGKQMSALGQASQQFDNIITVGASDGDRRAAYSSVGKGLDLVAPGSVQGSSFTGTSRSAAEVTGAVANVWAANSKLSDRQVIQVLESTAKDLGKPGQDIATGYGELNTGEAITLAEKTQPETYVFSGAELNQHSSWHSENGAIASERPDRYIDIADDGHIILGPPPKSLVSNPASSNTPTPADPPSSPSIPINQGPPQYASPAVNHALSAPVPKPQPHKDTHPQSSGNWFTDGLNNFTHTVGDVAGNIHQFTAEHKETLDWVHDGLSVAGLIPGVNVIADGLNTGLYLAEGDLGNAALSAVSMVPGLGEVGAGARLGTRLFGEGSKLVKIAGDVDKALVGVGKVQHAINRPLAMYGAAQSANDTINYLQKGDWQDAAHAAINTAVSGVGLFHSLKTQPDLPTKTPHLEPEPGVTSYTASSSTGSKTSTSLNKDNSGYSSNRPLAHDDSAPTKPQLTPGKPQDSKNNLSQTGGTTNHFDSSSAGSGKSLPPSDKDSPGSASNVQSALPSKDSYGFTSKPQQSKEVSPNSLVTPENTKHPQGATHSEQAGGNNNPLNNQSNDLPGSTSNPHQRNGGNPNSSKATQSTTTRPLDDAAEPRNSSSNSSNKGGGSNKPPGDNRSFAMGGDDPESQGGSSGSENQQNVSKITQPLSYTVKDIFSQNDLNSLRALGKAVRLSEPNQKPDLNPDIVRIRSTDQNLTDDPPPSPGLYFSGVPSDPSPLTYNATGDETSLPPTLTFNKISGGPMVRIQAPENGAPPIQVLVPGAGTTPVDLGLPLSSAHNPTVGSDKVVYKFTDVNTRGPVPDGTYHVDLDTGIVTPVDHPGVDSMDATKSLPPKEQGKYDLILINNPKGYIPNIQELGKGLAPNGQIVVQGTAMRPGLIPDNSNPGRTTTPDDRRGPAFNPDFQQVVNAGPIPGMTRVTSTQPKNVPIQIFPPTVDPPSFNPNSTPRIGPILGGPFSSTQGNRNVVPNARIIFVKDDNPPSSSYIPDEPSSPTISSNLPAPEFQSKVLAMMH